MAEEKQVIITEVGAFGNLNIDDPTTTDVKKKKNSSEDTDAMIAEAIAENAKIRI